MHFLVLYNRMADTAVQFSIIQAATRAEAKAAFYNDHQGNMTILFITEIVYD